MSYPSKTEFDNLRNSLPLTYQTRGNYAFRTDLASNINTALKNVNTALAFYAKKTDIPIVPANVATKTDLAGYALASDLGKYQPAGRYVSPSELENYQPKGDYASAKDLVSYAKSSDLANFQPKGDYAVKTDLDSYAKESSLASYQPKGDYALQTDLAAYQPKGDYAVKTDLAAYQPKGDFAVKSSLFSYALKSDLANFAVKTDLASYQPKGDYAVKTDLAGYQPKGNYALQPTAGNYALQTDLAAYQPKGDYAVKTDLVGYARPAAANEFLGTQTFKAGIILTANSVSDLLGAVKIPNATSISATNLTAGTITSTTMNLGTLNVSNINAASIAGYQTAGNYALQTDFTTLRNSLPLTYQTAGNYALAADVQKLQSNFTTGTTSILNIGEINAGRVSTGNASITNLTVGNFNMTGAPTFSAQATFKNNATVETTVGKPFQVIGPGGLRVTGGNLAVSGDTSIEGNSNVGNQHVRGIFPAPATSIQGLHFQWNRSGNDGESWIINNPGGGVANAGIRFGKSNAQNVVTEFGRFNNDGAFSVEGSSTFKGASTFKAQATFEKNATVTTTANNPFQVVGDGGLKIAAGGLVVGGGVWTNGTLDAATANIGTANVSGTANIATANVGTANVSGNASIAGSLSANHVFLESGGDPALRLGPGIKGTGNARLNVQDKSGAYMRFFQGANESGSITHDGGTALNVTKVNANSANINGDSTVKGNSFVGDNLILDGDNSWIIHTPNDGRKTMYVTPRNNAKTDWEWSKSTLYNADGSVNFSGSIRTAGSEVSHIQNPDSQLKMNSHGIMFGGNNNGKEINSAQISAGVHVANSLNIVGMSDADKLNRKVDIWAEGGLTVHGKSLKIGDWIIRDEGGALVFYKDNKGAYVRADGWGIVRTADWKSAAF